MRWRGNRKSSNVDDRRGSRYAGMGSAGGGGLLRLLPFVYRILGFKGTAIVLLCAGAYGVFSGNLNSILGLQQNNETKISRAAPPQSAEEKELLEFVSVVLADTEDTWKSVFQQEKRRPYEEPRLILFRHSVRSACGMAQSATGPFYCPGDRQVYLDLTFFDQLKNRFNAPGDFARAYVIAHEVGHHIQTLTGVSNKVHAARGKLNDIESNKLSVLQELQADCYAGVWAKHANDNRQLLEAGDVEEGLAAASAIGDDTLQKQARGYVTPDSFTHGSAAQRVKWFKIGLATGDMKQCDTFDAD